MSYVLDMNMKQLLYNVGLKDMKIFNKNLKINGS